jgi:bifunctional UDP-N-acetylglucosamine pyrophosphorylase/glucosamine-1-phosphate N-acetyltransferase
MAGGISAGLDLVDDDDSVLVLGGNDFVETSAIANLIKIPENCDGKILAKTVENYFPGGYLKIDENHKITKIIEKPHPDKVPSNLINIVAHFFRKSGDLKKELISAKSENDDVYETALDALFQTKNFVAEKYDGVWQSIKFPWHVLEMSEIFLARQKSFVSKTAEIAKSAVLKKNVFVADGARILENAVVENSFIGKNAIVGNNALVRDSIVGENSVAGFNTEIARSFLGKNVSTHFAYLGDSVVCDNVNFGAFATTANLRLDRKTVQVKIKTEKIDSGHQKLGAIVGKNAQIGIHAKLMPGVKIEKNELVKPGEIKF